MIVRAFLNGKGNGSAYCISASQLGSDLLPFVLAPHSHCQRLAEAFLKKHTLSVKVFNI